MLSAGNFKVPLALMVKKKRIVLYGGLPEFKWSDLGEQDVVGQMARSEQFLWFSIVVVKNLKLDLSLRQFNVEKGKHILLLLLLLLLLLKVARNVTVRVFPSRRICIPNPPRPPPLSRHVIQVRHASVAMRINSREFGPSVVLANLVSWP